MFMSEDKIAFIIFDNDKQAMILWLVKVVQFLNPIINSNAHTLWILL
jgi:hypothetical protein